MPRNRTAETYLTCSTMFFFLSTIDANVFLSENLFMSSYYSRAEFVIVTIFIENIDIKKNICSLANKTSPSRIRTK